MSPVPPLLRIPVGVVVERRRAKSQWIDFVWRPIEALAGAPEAAPWTKLNGDDELATFYAGATEVELYPSETTNYRDNLATGTPLLWVVLRPTETEPRLELYAVTADPAEGEGYAQTGTDIVDSVPMPDAIADVVAAFVTEHHVERVFFKRKRDRADSEALAPRAPIKRDRRE
jgi:hypothetical protein